MTAMTGLTFLFQNFEPVFLSVLGTFLIGIWLAGRPVRLLLGLLALLVGALGLLSIVGLLPAIGIFPTGFSSPLGWMFLNAGMVLFVLSRTSGD